MVSTGLENPETWLGEDIYQNLNMGVWMKKCFTVQVIIRTQTLSILYSTCSSHGKKQEKMDDRFQGISTHPSSKTTCQDVRTSEIFVPS